MVDHQWTAVTDKGWGWVASDRRGREWGRQESTEPGYWVRVSEQGQGFERLSKGFQNWARVFRGCQ